MIDRANSPASPITPADRLIALIIARATTLVYPELLPELVGQLQRHDFRAVLFLIEHESDVDGALIASSELNLAGIIAAARPSAGCLASVRGRTPVLLYNCYGEAARVDSVSCDHAACGRMLASLLLQGGHRRFGIIASPGDSLVGVDRVAGAVEALKHSRALAFEVEPGDYSYESGGDAIEALFARCKPKPSAIIAANDAMALGALDRAKALQIRIPRDLSIVGMDGTQMARLPSYELTTMRQPLAVMARAAVDQLVTRMEDPDRPIEARLFAGEFIEGRTARLTRPPRGTRSPA